MNISGMQTTQAAPAMPQSTSTQFQQANELQRNRHVGSHLFQPYPPFMPRPRPGNSNNYMIGMINQMLQMLFKMLQSLTRRQPTNGLYDNAGREPDMSRLVGMPGQEALAEARRQGVPNPMIVRPDMVLTTDYVPGRLRIHVDNGGLVKWASWG